MTDTPKDYGWQEVVSNQTGKRYWAKPYRETRSTDEWGYLNVEILSYEVTDITSTAHLGIYGTSEFWNLFSFAQKGG